MSSRFSLGSPLADDFGFKSPLSTDVSIAQRPVVFISYHPDKAVRDCAKSFADYLIATGTFSVPFIMKEDRLMSANKYGRLTEVIKASQAVVIFYNELYQNNAECQQEATFSRDQGKKLLFVKIQTTDFKDEDWFHAIKGGHTNIKYYEESDPNDTILWHVKELFGLNFVYVPTIFETERFILVNVEPPPPYFERKNYETSILDEIRDLCAKPREGALVITGDGGIGKTTIMQRIFTNTDNFDFFLDECKAGTAVWMNCFEWQNANEFNLKQRRSFLNALLAHIRLKLDSVTRFNRLIELVAFFKQRSQSVIFIFDDLFNVNLLAYVRKICPDAPCIVINRDPAALTPTKEAPLVRRVVQVEELCENEIQIMLETTFALGDKLSEPELMALASHCYGLPLIASLLAGNINNPPENESENCDPMSVSDVNKLNVTGPHGTVQQLFQFSLNMMNLNFRLAYYAFLLFDPAEPVSVIDLAILWGDDTPNRIKTSKLCKIFADKSLIRKVTRNVSPDEDFWLVHQMLHDAATKCAIENYKLSDVGSLSAIQLQNLIGNHNLWKKATPDESGMKKLCLAVKQRRLSLLTRIIGKLSAEDLAELCRQKGPETSGMTFIHYLYTVDWSEKQNFYLGANISYRLIKEIIYKLRDFDVDFVSIVKEERQPGNFSAANRKNAKYKSLLQHIFSDKDAWRYTPDRNCLIEMLGQSLKKLNDERKWEESFCINDAFRRFLAFVKEGDAAKCDLFLSSYDGKAMNRSEQVELMICAARKGNLIAVLKLSNIFPDAPRLQNRKGTTALMMAAANGHYKVVHYLSDRYVEVVSKVDDSGFSAMMHAAFNGHLDIVRLLLEKAPDGLRQKDCRGWIPLMHAATNGFLNVVKYMCEKCPEQAKFQNANSGLTPLMQAARCGHFPIVEYLHSIYPSAVTLQDKDSWTALMFAVSGGHLDVVEFLCEAWSIALQKTDKNGLTLLMCAARYGHFDVVDYLHEKDPGAIFACDKDGRTAMMHASACGHAAVVEELRELEIQTRCQSASLSYSDGLLRRSGRHLTSLF